MTWLTSWPESGVPVNLEHATEAEALAHADWLVKSGVTPHATAWEMGEKVPRACEVAAVGPAGVEVAPELQRWDSGPQIEREDRP